MSYIWKRIEPEDSNDSSECDLEEEFAHARRVYGLSGEQYPRLVISIYGPSSIQRVKGLFIETRLKNTPREWWFTDLVGVPTYLLGDLVEMLSAAKLKLDPLRDGIQ